jgi:hypothetical protein
MYMYYGTTKQSSLIHVNTVTTNINGEGKYLSLERVHLSSLLTDIYIYTYINLKTNQVTRYRGTSL